ncbi:MAG: prephenate dehydrogenase/arogenate dehydrogenase family protein [Lachnospiraceae bacterium]
MKKTPEIVGFVGLGLIGGSLVKAIRHFYPEIHLIATSGRKSTVDYALAEHLIDEGTYEINEAFSRCDYIFLCAPVSCNAEYLEALKPIIKQDCIITDVGSTKTDIHQKVIDFDMEANFIGGHPMAGSEKTGLKNSKRHLIENAYYCITPSGKVSSDTVDDYVEFISSLKALPLVLNYEEHDYITAAISHLPHLIAAGLVNLVKHNDSEKEIMKTVAAGGFKDITRIASSSPVMWEQICMTNHRNISVLLDKYIRSMQDIKHSLDHRCGQEIYDLFAESGEYRNSISDHSHGPIKKAYSFYVDLLDETGGIATVATILACNQINLKNIGIVNNREFEEAVLKIEFYEEEPCRKAVQLLRKHRYTVYER